MARFKEKFYVERGPDGDEVEIALIARGSYTYTAGFTSGPPEKCYPSDEDFEYELFTDDGKPWTGTLTTGEEDALRMQAIEALADAEDYEPEYEPDYD